jgi:hypothetical protein
LEDTEEDGGNNMLDIREVSSEDVMNEAGSWSRTVANIGAVGVEDSGSVAIEYN